MPGIAPVQPGRHRLYVVVGPVRGISFAAPGIEVLLLGDGTAAVGHRQDGAKVVGIDVVVGIRAVLPNDDGH